MHDHLAPPAHERQRQLAQVGQQDQDHHVADQQYIVILKEGVHCGPEEKEWIVAKIQMAHHWVL